jgi:hypothetical protein
MDNAGEPSASRLKVAGLGVVTFSECTNHLFPVIRLLPLRLAGNDRPVRNRLVGVAGHKSDQCSVLETHAQPRPAEVNLALDDESQPEITIFYALASVRPLAGEGR